MISQCPKCKTRLADFALTCSCGWSLDEDQPVELKPILDNNAGSGDSVVMGADISQQESQTDLQLKSARDAIDQQDYASALVRLNRAIVDAPNDRLAECYSLRGFVQVKNGEFSRAEGDCTQAINRSWVDALTYAWRATARGEQQKWREAFDDLDQACRLAGNQQDQYLGLMQSYSQAASAYFREQIQENGMQPDTFYDRGWIYFLCGKFDKAERDFQKALELKADHARASLGLAKLRFRKSKVQEVSDLCKVALGGDTECQLQAAQLLAQVQHREGDFNGCQTSLNTIRQLAGNDSNLLTECGKLRCSLGDYIEAISDLNSAIKADEHNFGAILARGDCYREIRNYSLAIDDYTRFLRFMPDDVEARVHRAETYLATKQHDRALVDFERALKNNDICFEAYLGRSRVFLTQEKLDAALTECQKAVRLDNQHPEAFATLADIYYKLCDFSRAIEEFSRAVQLAKTKPEKAQFLYRRGTAYYEMKDFENALKDFNKACKYRPNHGGSWIWKAATCSRMEKWTEAIMGLQQAIAVRPSSAAQYHALGRPVAERAVEFFTRQHQRGKKSSSLFQHRGLASQFLGKLDNSVADYTTALNMDADDVETRIRRGQVFARLGDHESAIEDFSYVIRRSPENHDARYHRAISHLASEKFDEAKSDIIKAIKFSKGHPRYQVLYGELFQKQNDLAKAIKAFDKAISLDPTDPFTYRRRGSLFASQKQYLNAVSDFTRSLELYPAQTDVLVLRGQSYQKSGQHQLALEDFELALTRDDKLSRAYSGRAAVLVQQRRHEYALIWLTKAIHRFESPRELAEILFARGKAYYSMGRIEPAIRDFTTVIDLNREDRKTVAAARIARGIARAQMGEIDLAKQDFERVQRIQPKNEQVNIALNWFANGKGRRPSFLDPPPELVRPTRPPIVIEPVELNGKPIKWEATPPHDSWVLRCEGRKEFGPVHYDLLCQWLKQGRIASGMKLLRSDWSKWKRAEKIFPELDPTPEDIESFPEIEIAPHVNPTEEQMEATE